MGRSRAPSSAPDDDLNAPGSRSKRRRVASGGDNLSAGQEGKKALYHCNYCNKDISGIIRIKCAKCPDFDLCVECFSIGAEVSPHKCNHPYKVIDNLSFPLIHPDWNADEEILLLEGVEMYGLGNWAEVAEHVATKSKAQCHEHYMTLYMNSSCSPLPDMAHVVGKSKAELLAMGKTVVEETRGFSVQGEVAVIKPPKQEPSISPGRVKLEERDAVAGGRSPSLTADKGQSNRSIGVKKPKPLSDESMTESAVLEQSGYNPKRQEFDPEYDNEAEAALADMEFKDTDTETDRELKVQMLHIYQSRLDERRRRRDFIIKRGLLDVEHQQELEKKRSKEHRELYQRARVFLRYHSLEDHENLISGLITEHRLRQRIKDLQECRAAGCRTIAEADQYIAEKKKQKEANGPIEPVKGEQRTNAREKRDGDADVSNNIAENQKMNAGTPSLTESGVEQLTPWDMSQFPGTNLLSYTEQKLCCQNRLLPAHYLRMKEAMMLESLKKGTIKRLDAHRLVNGDTSKVDRVYELLTKMGWIQNDGI